MEWRATADTYPGRRDSKAHSWQDIPNLLTIRRFSFSAGADFPRESKIASLYSRSWIAAPGGTRRARASELQRQAAHDALRGTHDEQFVEDRLVRRRVAEEISNADQHLPLRVAEVHERQRLAHLEVEPRVEAWMRIRRARERVAHTVQHDDVRQRFGDVGFERGGDVVDV